MNGNRTTGPYDDSRWQWVSDHYGPMGWFTDAQKRKHEGTGAFAEGHWRALSADEIERMNRWWTDLYRAQA